MTCDLFMNLRSDLKAIPVYMAIAQEGALKWGAESPSSLRSCARRDKDVDYTTLELVLRRLIYDGRAGDLIVDEDVDRSAQTRRPFHCTCDTKTIFIYRVPAQIYRVLRPPFAIVIMVLRWNPSLPRRSRKEPEVGSIKARKNSEPARVRMAWPQFTGDRPSGSGGSDSEEGPSTAGPASAATAGPSNFGGHDHLGVPAACRNAAVRTVLKSVKGCRSCGPRPLTRQLRLDWWRLLRPLLERNTDGSTSVRSGRVPSVYVGHDAVDGR